MKGDGYGTLILPLGLGTYTNALRVHTMIHETDTNTSTGTAVIQHNTHERYYWFTPGFHHPIMYFYYSLLPSTGVMTLAFVKIYRQYTAGTPLGAEAMVKEDDLQVFPNPARDVINIRYNQQDNTDPAFVLSDVLGRQVKQVTGASGEAAIVSAELPAGLYLLQMRQRGGVLTRKIQLTK